MRPILCPKCKKILKIPQVAYTNIEAYGNSFCNITCAYCGATVQVYGANGVSFHNPVLTNELSDWK